jgi:hypothetical protein
LNRYILQYFIPGQYKSHRIKKIDHETTNSKFSQILLLLTKKTIQKPTKTRLVIIIRISSWILTNETTSQLNISIHCFLQTAADIVHVSFIDTDTVFCI